MNEQPLFFGPGQSLFGILTHGEPGADLAVLLPNVGLDAHAGPHRLMVKLGRALAAEGMPSLRFDVSGIGESASTRSAGDGVDQAVADLVKAMDELQHRLGIQRFMLFGVCSGAVHSYFAALQDTRVVGLFMLDGFSYPNRNARLRYLIDQFRNVPPRLLYAKLRIGLRNLLRPPPQDLFVAALDQRRPPVASFRASLKQLLARGTQLCLFYSGSLRTVNLPYALLGALRDPELLRKANYRYERDIDHTATPLYAQRRLIEIVCEWSRKLHAPRHAGPVTLQPGATGEAGVLR